MNKYPVEEVARLIAEEVELGVEINNYNGPIVMRSTAKAGVIKLDVYKRQGLCMRYCWLD